MDAITALLIDDEPNNSVFLRGLLEEHFPVVDVAAVAVNAAEASAMVEQFRPNLVFLDVELPGTTGVDWLRQLPQISFEVIFVTAYNHYALQAFESHAIGYLTKPLVIEKFRTTLQHAIDRIQEKSVNTNLLQVLGQLQAPQHQPGKIPLATQSGLVFVKQSDIVHCQSSGNYTYFYLAGNKVLLVSRQLGEYEKLLPAQQFVRIHDQHIINLDYLSEYLKGSGGEVKLENGKTLPVAGRRKEELLNRFEKWLRRK